MEIILEVNDQPYQNFKSVNVNRSMETLSGTFDFVATIDSFKNFPIKLQDRARVLINNIPLITGFIEVVEPSYTNNSHEIRLSGRDLTADVVDSSVLSNVNYSPNITLLSIVKNLIRGNNLDIKVIDKVDPAAKIFKLGDIVGGEVGQNMFEIIDKYCTKRQVLATTDGNGNIILTRASKEVVPIVLTQISQNGLNPFNKRKNNILSASASYSMENRFHSYIVKSQLNPTALNISGGKASSESIVQQNGGTIDNEVRNTRDFVLSADISNSSQTANERAIWEANVRRARGFTYNCTVQGYFVDKERTIIWEPNKLVQVEDEKTDVSSQLLILGVNYSFSRKGSLVNMEMGYRDSFTLNAEQEAIEAKSNLFGFDI